MDYLLVLFFLMQFLFCSMSYSILSLQICNGSEYYKEYSLQKVLPSCSLHISLTTEGIFGLGVGFELNIFQGGLDPFVQHFDHLYFFISHLEDVPFICIFNCHACYQQHTYNRSTLV